MIGTLRDTSIGYRRWISAELRSRFLRSRRRRAEAGRSALLLAHCLPPATTGGVYRPLSWMTYGSRRQWRFCAVSSAEPQRSPAGEHLLRSVPQTASMIRYRPASEQPAWRFFPRVDGGFMNALAMFEAARNSCAASPPAVVVATGPSFYVFIAGLFAARHWRAPLVLDYRDEWTECPFGFVVLGNMDRYWETRCLSHADRVVFTTRSQREHQLATFDCLAAEKCLVIPNGWEPADWSTQTPTRSTVQRPPPAASGDEVSPIRIAYVGTLSDHASPDGFLADIGALIDADQSLRARLELAFVGRCTGSTQEALARAVARCKLRVVGEVSRPQANEAMRAASILLLIARKELERYLPGKLYEYVASGRPILVYGCEGEASRLVRDTDSGIYVREGDVEGLRHAILELAARPARGDLAEAHRRWLEQHTRGALADRLFDVLETLVQRGGSPASGNARTATRAAT